MKLDTVSVTEVSTFRTCRRQWYLGTALNLQAKSVNTHLWFGTLIHTALETYFDPTHHRDLDLALAAYNKSYKEEIKKMAKNYPIVWKDVQQEFHDAYLMGIDMLKNYHTFEQSQSVKWDTVAIEQRVWVPIRTANGRQSLKGQPRLTARMDRVAAVGDDLIIEDHKTAGQRPSLGRALEIDDQLTGYAYVYWRITGELPRLLVYDVLIKRVPKEPLVLKSGDLSTDKGQMTTFHLYLEALRRMNIPIVGKYMETLESYRTKGWSDYFAREGTSRNFAQVKSYEQHLYYTFQDMRAVIENPALAYPNPSQMNCPGCPFLSVCVAMEEGSDFQSIIDANYEEAEEKRW